MSTETVVGRTCGAQGTSHAGTLRATPRARTGLAAGLLAALIVLTGCDPREEIEATVAETDAFCAANPVPPLPAPLQADRVFIGAGGLTRSWMYWIPERLLRGGFVEIESPASIAPYIDGTGEFLRFRIATATDPGCAGQAALARSLPPQDWQRIQRHWVDLGLRQDQCLAIERSAIRRSPYWLEVWDASAQLRDPGPGVPIERKRIHFVAREAASGRVLHEHYAEHGFINLGMPTPFGCMRRAEWDAFTDTLIRGTVTRAVAEPAGPETIETPALPPTLRSEPVAERVRDLGRTPIDGVLLSQRREVAGADVEGFEVLIGRDTNPYAINPAWPRYLQLSLDGRYRRVRLPWLEGVPHGMHDRPLRLFDLGERIGLLSITQFRSPERRGIVDLSWTEFSRADGLPLLRADASVSVDPEAESDSLVEDVERTADGLRFRLTEIDVERGAGMTGGFVQTRETSWFWPIPARP